MNYTEGAQMYLNFLSHTHTTLDIKWLHRCCVNLKCSLNDIDERPLRTYSFYITLIFIIQSIFRITYAYFIALNSAIYKMSMNINPESFEKFIFHENSTDVGEIEVVEGRAMGKVLTFMVSIHTHINIYSYIDYIAWINCIPFHL